MTSDEARLLELARQGDLDAFAEFVRVFERRIRAVLGRILDDERDVDEAAQDTFVQAWRHLDRFRGDAKPSTWLYRIAVNEALQRTRRKRLDTRPFDGDEGRPAAGEGPGSRSAPQPSLEEKEELRFLTERVAALPVDLRVPLVLRDVEGLSNQEVADTLDVTVPAAKSRIHRARMQLREDYDAWRSGEG